MLLLPILEALRKQNVPVNDQMYVHSCARTYMCTHVHAHTKQFRTTFFKSDKVITQLLYTALLRVISIDSFAFLTYFLFQFGPLELNHPQ